MDLRTHCPQCATAFLVSEEQLELAQGWVRCGVCQEVFMAQAHTTAPVVQAAVLEEPLLQRQETMAPDEPLAPIDATSTMSEPPRSRSAPPPTAPAPSQRNDRRASFGALLLLITALTAQVGMDAYRVLPDAQPAIAIGLQTLCPPTRCALRQSSALVIDDSSLTSAGANAFHLKAMISNRSRLTLEAPSLALTLTDAADEVLARKVYPRKEWAAPEDGLQSQSATPIDLWVQWNDPASTSRVTGYRLQAFYP